MKSSSFATDYKFGQVEYIRPASEEDMKQGIDAWLGNIPFTWRRRRISIMQYGEISIRSSRDSGTKTEYQKLLDGDIKAVVYVFEFTDAIVICTVADIVQCMRCNAHIVKGNHDGTWAAYIKLENIKHLLIKR